MTTYSLVQAPVTTLEKAVNAASAEGWELHSFSVDDRVYAVMEKVEAIGPGQSRVW